MKIAVITDTHWGARNDNAAIADHIIKFHEEVFFPYLIDNGITTIFHLGDLTDRRKYINFVTLKNMYQHFIKRCHDLGMELHIIAGNHDTFYKNTNEVNSLRQLYGDSPNDKMHLYWSDPVELNMDGCKIMLAPWICAENSDRSMAAMSDTKAQILMGHFEITGYEMMRGQLCSHGMDRKVFSKFDDVYSGHFHHPSSHSNITYLGAPYEMNWSDHGGKRGFHIFDTDTREMEFVQNPNRIFHIIDYSDVDMTIEDVTELDTSLLKNTYIKVNVKRRENPYIFDLFLERLYAGGAVDIKVVEDQSTLEVIDEDELLDEAQDTLTILNQYVNNLEIKTDKSRVETLIRELYSEAMSL